MMSHSVKTAERHYILKNKQNQVVETSQVVKELQRTNYNERNQTNVFNIDDLCQIFGDGIKMGRITTDRVKRKWNENNSLVDYISSPKKVKKNVDIICYKKKKKKKWKWKQ